MSTYEAVALVSSAGSIIVLLIIAMWRFQNGKIEKKVDLRSHKIEIEAIKKDLAKVDMRFESISLSLEEQGKMLARIDECTMHLARKSGIVLDHE